jgi:uncharacterized damage-inducible protein DinB
MGIIPIPVKRQVAWMRMFFEYNWQVREDWFRWCESHLDELDKPRTGGLGSIRKTLFHVVNVEQSWIRELAGLPEIQYHESSFPTLQHIREFSQRHRGEIIQFLESWTPDMEHKVLRGFKSNANRSNTRTERSSGTSSPTKSTTWGNCPSGPGRSVTLRSRQTSLAGIWRLARESQGWKQPDMVSLHPWYNVVAHVMDHPFRRGGFVA